MDSIVKHEILRQIGEPGVVAVIRARSPEEGIALGEALLEGGIRAVEVAMTTPGGLKVLESLAARLADRGLLLGAGTVLDPETARAVLQEGKTVTDQRMILGTPYLTSYGPLKGPDGKILASWGPDRIAPRNSGPAIAS